MHYIANTLYQTGDRDHNGRRAGEPSYFEDRIYFSDGNVAHEMERGFVSFLKSRMREVESGIYKIDKAAGEFEVISMPYEEDDSLYTEIDDKYTFVGFGDKWHDCPFNDELTAREWAEALNAGRCVIKKVPIEFSAGKERNLEAARRVACWPEALRMRS